ncbi:MAG: rhodanese-like domain-containing protein [Patescibacteria group bacterium]
MKDIQTYTVISLATAVVLIALIYLTPLKHINLIEPTIDDINPQEFHAMFVANPDNYIFIDVRPENAYTAAHALGSESMPLHTLFDTRHLLPKTGKTIVLICSGGRASGVGYSYLEHYGFFNIKRIDGGIERWISMGLPVDGKQVIK